MDIKSGVTAFDLLDFMLAVVHVAYHRFAAESPTQVCVCVCVCVSGGRHRLLLPQFVVAVAHFRMRTVRICHKPDNNR